jgi:hypothetical protein
MTSTRNQSMPEAPMVTGTSAKRLVQIGIAIETMLFGLQWALQGAEIGGLFRDLGFVAASLILTAWLSWCLGKLPTVGSWGDAAFLGVFAVWGWGYLLLPMIRIGVELAAGILPMAQAGAGAKGVVSAFLAFVLIPSAVAIGASIVSTKLRSRSAVN